MRGSGRGQARAIRREARVVDEQVELGAAAGVGAQRAVLVEVQLSRVHHLPGETETEDKPEGSACFLSGAQRSSISGLASFLSFHLDVCLTSIGRF